MKRCDCCEAVIADRSLRLICPPCASDLVVSINTPALVCRLHGREVAWGEWDNHSVDLPSKL